MLALDTLAIDLDLLAVEHLRPAMDHLDPVLFQQGGNASGQAVDDAVLPATLWPMSVRGEATLMPSSDGPAKREVW